MSKVSKFSTDTDRGADHPVDSLFLHRWSPRAFAGASISEHDLFTLFEAARWAPSSMNYQPWRLIYTRRESERWDEFLGLLNEKNQLWAKQASALVYFASLTTISYGGSDVPSPTHAFDTGSAWSNLAHQAWLIGYSTRGIAGFDRTRAPEVLGLPDGIEIIAAAAIGVPAPSDVLPENLREREKPTPRKLLTEIVFENSFRPSSD